MVTDNPGLHEACVSALWQIKGTYPSATLQLEPPTYQAAISQGASPYVQTGRVMLSYQWDHQKQVIKIRDKLKDAGYDVWMDVTNMSKEISWYHLKKTKKQNKTKQNKKERKKKKHSV